MTETAPPPTDQRATFSRWTAEDRDLWVDLLESFAGVLLEQAVRPDASVITDAAMLADQAVKEAQYRFWIQRKARPKKATPKKRSGSKVVGRRK